MHHITRSKATLQRNGTVKSYEYDTPSQSINMSIIYVNGRYPERDFTVNREVESLIHVVKGSGVFSLTDEKKTTLKKGDQLYIPKNEAYYFEGALELVYAATPKWTQAQVGRTAGLKPSTDAY